MRFTSGVSDALDAQDAVSAVCQQVRDQLADANCHVAFVFVSTSYRTSWSTLLASVSDRLKPDVLIGCSGSGIIGGGQELEGVPAVSIVAANLPGVRLFPFVISPEEMELSSPGGFWVDKIGVSPEAQPVFILVVDPSTCQPAKLLADLNATYRTRPIVGGLVSGGNEPGGHVILMGREVYHEGAVGVAMTGNIAMDPIISPGCRPIGRPYVITQAEEHVVYELGGRQALAVLHEVLSVLSVEDRALVQQGSVFAGLAITEMRQAFHPGDFLIRNLIGIEPETGALAVAEHVTVGRTLQFHLRDPSTSRQELRRLLQQLSPSAQAIKPVGGLLFTCTGRGKSLYGSAHQDVKMIQMVSGKLPIGGFFCNGEIGPVGGTNLLHSYTASLALFRPLGKERDPAGPSQVGG